MPERHRARIAVDVIYEGPKLSPSALRRVGGNVAMGAHAFGFEDIKNVSVVHTSRDERVIYAHHHDSSNGYCSSGRSSCLNMAQDGLSQEDL